MRIWKLDNFVTQNTAVNQKRVIDFLKNINISCYCSGVLQELLPPAHVMKPGMVIQSSQRLMCDDILRPGIHAQPRKHK
jgi:hypothetical protein